MAPGAFPVHSAAEWQSGLLAKRVMADAAHRRRHIADGVDALAAAQNLTVVDDPALLDEVAGLVEWPVSPCSAASTRRSWTSRPRCCRCPCG